MYLIYTVTLIVLVIILFLLWGEERRLRNSRSHGLASKYWVLKEKRRYVRFGEELRIRYDLTKAPQPSVFEASKTTNISKKGLCLVTYEKLKKKDMLTLEIELPDFSKKVSVAGKVMWVKDGKKTDSKGRRLFFAGIQFLKITPECEALLLAHLSRLKRE